MFNKLIYILCHRNRRSSSGYGGGAAGGGAVAAALGPVGWGLMAVSALTSIFGGGAKRRAARRAEERKRVLTNELNILEIKDKLL